MRHTEKVTNIKHYNDPILSPAGTKRAGALAKYLKRENIKAIYVTK
ncbi:broad specificity phosphatase PhoE [Mucilaginibacter sp. UYNi724]